MATSRELQILLTLKDQASQQLKGVQGELQKMQPTFKKMSMAGVAAFGVVSVATKKFIDKASELQQQTVAFTTLLGSEEAALAKLKELSEFAAKTPFEIGGIRQTSKQLLAMGISQEKLLPTLKSLGDVSAGLSVPIERLALNFGQVATQGQLTGREVRDFAIAGVPLVEELANMMGKTKSEIQDMVSAGQIGFPEVEQAFINMSSEGGKFADLMDKQSVTIAGRWSNLKDQLTLLSESIGTQLIPIINRLFDAVAPMLEKLAIWIQENPVLARNILLIVGALTGLVAVIGILGLALPPIIAGFVLLTSPITLVILAIGALIVMIVLLVKRWKETRDSFAIVWEAIKELFDRGKDYVKGKIDEIIGFFQNMINKAKEAIDKVKGAFGSIGGKISGGFNSLIGRANGGTVKKGETTLVGENGPEIAQFPGGTKIIPNNKIGGGSVINITVNGDVTGRELIEKVKNSIMGDIRSNERFGIV